MRRVPTPANTHLTKSINLPLRLGVFLRYIGGVGTRQAFEAMDVNCDGAVSFYEYSTVQLSLVKPEDYGRTVASLSKMLPQVGLHNNLHIRLADRLDCGWAGDSLICGCVDGVYRWQRIVRRREYASHRRERCVRQQKRRSLTTAWSRVSPQSQPSSTTHLCY